MLEDQIIRRPHRPYVKSSPIGQTVGMGKIFSNKSSSAVETG